MLLPWGVRYVFFDVVNLWVVGYVYGGCICKQPFSIAVIFYWGWELDACVNFIHVWDHAVQ